ncbi:MAG: hypothetical protein U0900_02740 [Myxococcota bacterium]
MPSDARHRASDRPGPTPTIASRSSSSSEQIAASSATAPGQIERLEESLARQRELLALVSRVQAENVELRSTQAALEETLEARDLEISAREEHLLVTRRGLAARDAQLLDAEERLEQERHRRELVETELERARLAHAELAEGLARRDARIATLSTTLARVEDAIGRPLSTTSARGDESPTEPPAPSRAADLAGSHRPPARSAQASSATDAPDAPDAAASSAAKIQDAATAPAASDESASPATAESSLQASAATGLAALPAIVGPWRDAQLANVCGTEQGSSVADFLARRLAAHAAAGGLEAVHVTSLGGARSEAEIELAAAYHALGVGSLAIQVLDRSAVAAERRRQAIDAAALSDTITVALPQDAEGVLAATADALLFADALDATDSTDAGSADGASTGALVERMAASLASDGLVLFAGRLEGGPVILSETTCEKLAELWQVLPEAWTGRPGFEVPPVPGDDGGTPAFVSEALTALRSRFRPAVTVGLGHVADLFLGPARGFDLDDAGDAARTLLDSIDAIDESRSILEGLPARHGVAVFSVRADATEAEAGAATESIASPGPSRWQEGRGNRRRAGRPSASTRSSGEAESATIGPASRRRASASASGRITASRPPRSSSNELLARTRSSPSPWPPEIGPARVEFEAQIAAGSAADLEGDPGRPGRVERLLTERHRQPAPARAILLDLLRQRSLAAQDQREPPRRRLALEAPAHVGEPVAQHEALPSNDRLRVARRVTERIVRVRRRGARVRGPATHVRSGDGATDAARGTGRGGSGIVESGELALAYAGEPEREDEPGERDRPGPEQHRGSDRRRSVGFDPEVERATDLRRRDRRLQGAPDTRLLDDLRRALGPGLERQDPGRHLLGRDLDGAPDPLPVGRHEREPDRVGGERGESRAERREVEGRHEHALHDVVGPVERDRRAHEGALAFVRREHAGPAAGHPAAVGLDGLDHVLRVPERLRPDLGFRCILVLAQRPGPGHEAQVRHALLARDDEIEGDELRCALDGALQQVVDPAQGFRRDAGASGLAERFEAAVAPQLEAQARQQRLDALLLRPPQRLGDAAEAVDRGVRRGELRSPLPREVEGREATAREQQERRRDRRAPRSRPTGLLRRRPLPRLRLLHHRSRPFRAPTRCAPIHPGCDRAAPAR